MTPAESIFEGLLAFAGSVRGDLPDHLTAHRADVLRRIRARLARPAPDPVSVLRHEPPLVLKRDTAYPYLVVAPRGSGAPVEVVSLLDVRPGTFTDLGAVTIPPVSRWDLLCRQDFDRTFRLAWALTGALTSVEAAQTALVDVFGTSKVFDGDDVADLLNKAYAATHANRSIGDMDEEAEAGDDTDAAAWLRWRHRVADIEVPDAEEGTKDRAEAQEALLTRLRTPTFLEGDDADAEGLNAADVHAIKAGLRQLVDTVVHFYRCIVEELTAKAPAQAAQLPSEAALVAALDFPGRTGRASGRAQPGLFGDGDGPLLPGERRDEVPMVPSEPEDVRQEPAAPRRRPSPARTGLDVLKPRERADALGYLADMTAQVKAFAKGWRLWLLRNGFPNFQLAPIDTASDAVVGDVARGTANVTRTFRMVNVDSGQRIEIPIGYRYDTYTLYPLNWVVDGVHTVVPASEDGEDDPEGIDDVYMEDMARGETALPSRWLKRVPRPTGEGVKIAKGTANAKKLVEKVLLPTGLLAWASMAGPGDVLRVQHGGYMALEIRWGLPGVKVWPGTSALTIQHVTDDGVVDTQMQLLLPPSDGPRLEANVVLTSFAYGTPNTTGGFALLKQWIENLTDQGWLQPIADAVHRAKLEHEAASYLGDKLAGRDPGPLPFTGSPGPVTVNRPATATVPALQAAWWTLIDVVEAFRPGFVGSALVTSRAMASGMAGAGTLSPEDAAEQLRKLRLDAFRATLKSLPLGMETQACAALNVGDTTAIVNLLGAASRAAGWEPAAREGDPRVAMPEEGRPGTYPHGFVPLVPKTNSPDEAAMAHVMNAERALDAEAAKRYLAQLFSLTDLIDSTTRGIVLEKAQAVLAKWGVTGSTSDSKGAVLLRGVTGSTAGSRADLHVGDTIRLLTGLDPGEVVTVTDAAGPITRTSLGSGVSDEVIPIRIRFKSGHERGLGSTETFEIVAPALGMGAPRARTLDAAEVDLNRMGVSYPFGTAGKVRLAIQSAGGPDGPFYVEITEDGARREDPARGTRIEAVRRAMRILAGMEQAREMTQAAETYVDVYYAYTQSGPAPDYLPARDQRGMMMLTAAEAARYTPGTIITDGTLYTMPAQVLKVVPSWTSEASRIHLGIAYDRTVDHRRSSGEDAQIQTSKARAKAIRNAVEALYVDQGLVHAKVVLANRPGTDGFTDIRVEVTRKNTERVKTVMAQFYGRAIEQFNVYEREVAGFDDGHRALPAEHAGHRGYAQMEEPPEDATEEEREAWGYSNEGPREVTPPAKKLRDVVERGDEVADAENAFYVSARKDGSDTQGAILLGPFETHDAAKAQVDFGRRLVHLHFASDPHAAFAGIGTARGPRTLRPIFTLVGEFADEVAEPDPEEELARREQDEDTARTALVNDIASEARTALMHLEHAVAAKREPASLRDLLTTFNELLTAKVVNALTDRERLRIDAARKTIASGGLDAERSLPPGKIDVQAVQAGRNARVLDALVALGWRRYGGTVELEIGGGATGGELNPTGRRVVFIAFGEMNTQVEARENAGMTGSTLLTSVYNQHQTGTEPATARAIDAAVRALDPRGAPAKGASGGSPMRPRADAAVGFDGLPGKGEILSMVHLDGSPIGTLVRESTLSPGDREAKSPDSARRYFAHYGRNDWRILVAPGNITSTTLGDALIAQRDPYLVVRGGSERDQAWWQRAYRTALTAETASVTPTKPQYAPRVAAGPVVYDRHGTAWKTVTDDLFEDPDGERYSRAFIEGHSGPLTAEKPGATVTTSIATSVRDASIEDLARDYKARGMDLSKAYNQLVTDKGLNPGIDLRDFRGIYDSVMARRLPTETRAVSFTPTHHDTLIDKRVQFTKVPGAERYTAVWEHGMTGTEQGPLAARYVPLDGASVNVEDAPYVMDALSFINLMLTPESPWRIEQDGANDVLIEKRTDRVLARTRIPTRQTGRVSFALETEEAWTKRVLLALHAAVVQEQIAQDAHKVPDRAIGAYLKLQEERFPTWDVYPVLGVTSVANDFMGQVTGRWGIWTKSESSASGGYNSYDDARAMADRENIRREGYRGGDAAEKAKFPVLASSKDDPSYWKKLSTYGLHGQFHNSPVLATIAQPYGHDRDVHWYEGKLAYAHDATRGGGHDMLLFTVNPSAFDAGNPQWVWKETKHAQDIRRSLKALAGATSRPATAPPAPTTTGPAPAGWGKVNPVPGPSFPPPPALRPARITVDSYGSEKGKTIPKGLTVIKFGYGPSMEFAKRALIQQGWTDFPRTRSASYLYLTPPDNKPLGTRDVHFGALVPDVASFNAWADDAKAYYDAHPESLGGGEGHRKGALGITPDTLSLWTYQIRHTRTNTTQLHTLGAGGLVPGEVTEHTYVDLPTLEWTFPGGTLRRVWQDDGRVTTSAVQHEAKRVRFEDEAPVTPAPSQEATTGAGEARAGCTDVTLTVDGESVRVVCGQKGQRDVWHNIHFRGTRYGYNGGRWARSQVPPANVLTAVRAAGITVFG